MELTFIFYIFAAFILIPGTFFIVGTIFKKYMAGGIGAIGMLIIFIVFGIQTFSPDGSYKSKITTPTSWPPSINYCPDFLSLLPASESDYTGGYICVDTVGVSIKGDFNSGGITVFNPATDTYDSINTDEQVFDLRLDIKDDIARTKQLQQNCSTMGLRWEGIYNGGDSSQNIAPRPSK